MIKTRSIIRTATAIALCLSFQGMRIFAADSIPKIKAAYFYDGKGNGEHLKTLAENGFNYALVKMSVAIEAPDTDAESLEKIRQSYLIASKNGVRFTPVLNWAGKREVALIRRKNLGCYISESLGELKKTPCPMDEEYWNDIVFKRFSAVAAVGPRDILLDPEMYGADTTLYSSACLCPHCIAAFEHSVNVDIPDKPKNGVARWLKEKKLLRQYSEFQELSLTRIMRETSSRLRDDFPELRLGFLNYYPGRLFYRCLAKGFGTAKNPCTAWLETPTYESGYTSYVNKLATDLTPNARLVCGLWIQKFYPDELGAHAYHLAKNSDGYWLFTTHSFQASDYRKLNGAYSIPASPEDYYAALKDANAEIYKLDDDQNYTSHLKLGKRRIVLGNGIQSRGGEFPDLSLLLEKSSYSRSDFPAPFFRYSSTVFFYLKKGQVADVEIKCKQLVSHYVSSLSWGIFNADNEGLKCGVCKYNESEIFKFRAPANGVYALVGRTKSNIFSMHVKNCPQVYELSPDVRFYHSVPTTLYFFVPTGVKEFTIHPSTRGREIGKFDIMSPASAIVARTNGRLQESLRIEVPEKLDGKIWKLRIHKAKLSFDDFVLRLGDNIPPYVSEKADWLMVPQSFKYSKQVSSTADKQIVSTDSN